MDLRRLGSEVEVSKYSKILSKKKFWGPKNISGQKEILGMQKKFGCSTIVGCEKKLWVKKDFELCLTSYFNLIISG